jgi:hypothetical protein
VAKSGIILSVFCISNPLPATQVSGSLYGALIGSATAFTIADFLGTSILPAPYSPTCYTVQSGLVF